MKCTFRIALNIVVTGGTIGFPIFKMHQEAVVLLNIRHCIRLAAFYTCLYVSVQMRNVGVLYT